MNHRNTLKNKILNLLREYPEGMNAAKIFEMITENFSVTRACLSVTLAVMTKRGFLSNAEYSCCKECAINSVNYKIRRGKWN